jgi:hypothetical protein
MPQSAIVHGRDGYPFSDDGVQPWMSKELSQALRQASRELIGVTLTLQVRQHLALAIDRYYLQGIGAARTGNPATTGVDIDNGLPQHTIHHLLASHAAKTGNTIYANSALHASNITDAAIHSYLDLSQRWHCLAGVGLSPPPKPSAAAAGVKCISLAVPLSASSERNQSIDTTTERMALQAVLAAHTGDHQAAFRSE